jgi:hypothetical protein
LDWVDIRDFKSRSRFCARARSSSISTSCSAAREYIALTEYRFVIRFVSRLLFASFDEPEGEGREAAMVIVAIIVGG